MSVLECLKWHNFASSQQEILTTDGKSGVPCFSGQVTKLAEYQFRVRVRQSMEKTLTEDDLRKRGPLGVRLIDGLKGPALQVARGLPIDKLSEEGGPSFLLKSLQPAFQPRVKQEARDLYQVGAQNGGMLSRQSGESMVSYVLRRRTWHDMMTGLDAGLTLPDGILAEQLLSNSGLSSDHQLLIRTALQGDLTFTKVSEEFIAQHSRLHEREHKGKGNHFRQSLFSKGGKSFGKKSGSWKSYHVEDDASESWENASQSLGEYEDYDMGSAYYTAEEASVNEAHEVSEYDMASDSFQAFESYAAMVEVGLDEQDQESLDLAAEVIQSESEAYFMRQKAMGSGHKGFSGQGPRNFQVHGSLSLEEKKAKLQAVKSRTMCKRCWQYGHWQDDPVCPKGGGKKGAGKSKTFSSASTTASTQGKGKNFKGQTKPGEKNRTVYFTINEYEGHGAADGTSYMTQKENYQAVPPPSSLDPPQPAEETADAALDRLIAEAAFRQHMSAPVFFDPAEIADQPHVQEPPQPQRHDSAERHRHLDLFLQTASRDHPDWEDANRERWNEFVPGHPLFSAEDQQNIARWQEKARLGLPRIPDQVRQAPLQEPAWASAGCQHKNITTHGTNSKSRQVKCKDCGVILEKTARVPTEKMQTEHRGSCEHKDKDFSGTTSTTWQWTCRSCGHIEKGSKRPGQTGRQASSAQSAASGLNLQATPSGKVRVDGGPRQVMELMQTVLELQEDLQVDIGGDQLDRIYQRCRQFVYSTATRAVEANPGAQGYPVNAPAAASTVGTGHPAEGETRQESPSTAATGDGTLLSSGIHQGKMYAWVYQNETAYTKMLISKNQNDRLRDPHLISYALYAEDRKRRGGTNTAFMSQLLEETEEEDYMLAVLDTGCNNTCHGDKWMEKYQRLIGRELEAEPADGRFKGVGGKVEVACKRIIPMQMLTVDQEKIPGSIASVELQSSDTPLLLSIHAQRTLGLILDLQNNTAYSKYLDKELQLHGHNGLPAIRLHPGEFQVGSVAMHVQESEGSEEKTRPKVIDLEAMDDHISEEGEEEPVEVSGKEVEAGYERHLPLAEESIKVLSKGQKKQLQESLDEMDHQDSALWSTLASKPRQPKKMLPKGCRTFLMELFAGTATLTLMAAQMGLPVSEPIDVLYDGKYDLLKRENRERISWQIEQDDPYLLSMTPICGPRSSWQYVNMARGGETAEHILEQRKQWYPVIRWLCDVVKKRLAKGREVVWENPWGSLMWYLRCVEQLMEAQITNALTFEPLEILRMDQCMYGLVDPRTGIPYRKATGLMLPSRHMKEELSELCDGSHIHQPLEGNLTKQAEHWPEELCHRVLRGAMRELQSQALSMAFPVEQVAEEREEVGCLDAIHDSRDLEESPMKKQKIDHDEIQREEIFEEMTDEDKMLHQKERDRKAKWLKLNKEKRIALRRLHAMMGHCSVATMTRMLKSSLASKDLLDAVPHFRCQSCEERRREEAPRSVRPTRSKAELKFNYELAVMCLR